MLIFFANDYSALNSIKFWKIFLLSASQKNANFTMKNNLLEL